MKNKTLKRIKFLLLSPLVFLLACHEEAPQTKPPIHYVNTFIGTSYSTTPSILKHQEFQNENKGQTIPAVGFPHAHTNWTPQTRATEQKCLAPYYYFDSLFQGFRASHWMSGSCTQDYGSVTIMPLNDTIIVEPQLRASSFRHTSEVSSPAYYSVHLDDYNIFAELTGRIYSGIQRFTFYETDSPVFVIEPNSDEGKGYIEIHPEKQEITGFNPAHRIYQGWGKSAGFSGYFIIRFNEPFEDFGCWKDSVVSYGVHSSALEAGSVGAFVRLNKPSGEPVEIKVGMSFTSLDKARENLLAETRSKSFDEIKNETEQEWNRALGQMDVASKDTSLKTIFYSALYHTKLLPRIFSDIDGSFVGFAEDSGIYIAEDYQYYADFTTWDSYRAVHPLMTILEPDRTQDIVRSLINKAEQGGWLPIFPCWNNYTSGMIGDHLISVIGDAYLKGLNDFDIEKAYHYMRQNAFESPKRRSDYREGKGRRALNTYKKYGFIPLEDPVKEAFHKGEQVSRTLEYAYDDFVLARVAEKLGHTQDYEELMQRSLNYRNVFDTITGYVRGRHKDGRWIEPFDPNIKAGFITEGTAFQYTWYVPQDPIGLALLMGGTDKMGEKLNLFFDTDEYWHGNEPGHQTAYMYAWTNQPWQTQNRVREILEAEYTNTPGGLSGNDDVGQMSAWAVFSMAGFYPVCPGTGEYILGSPVFDRITIQLPNGKDFSIECKNNSENNRYIRKAKLNGRRLNRLFITHDEILEGGNLLLFMSDKPKKKTNYSIKPYSITNTH